MRLETFQQLQETRRRRTRRTGEPSTFEVYVLSGATCGGCGGKVTAQTKRRIDRLVHHAEILSLKGDSYRLRGKDLSPARRVKIED